MLKENHLEFFKNYGVLAARVLMGGMFVLTGLDKLRNAAGTAEFAASMGMPESVALIYLVGTFEVVAGGAIIFGRYMAEAALLLAVFVLFVSFPFHGPAMWADNPTQQILFTKNMAILAGLLYMVAYAKRKSGGMKLGTSGGDRERPAPGTPSL